MSELAESFAAILGESASTATAWIAMIGVAFAALCSGGSLIVVAVLNRRTNRLRGENADQHGENLSVLLTNQALAIENQGLLTHLSVQAGTNATLLAEMQAAFISHIAIDTEKDDAIIVRLDSLERLAKGESE